MLCEFKLGNNTAEPTKNVCRAGDAVDYNTVNQMVDKISFGL